MSEPLPESINLKELCDEWPQDSVGALCKRLVLRYLNEVLLQSSSSADANPVTAQGEAGAAKALSTAILDFRKVLTSPIEQKQISVGKPLKRFFDSQSKAETKP